MKHSLLFISFFLISCSPFSLPQNPFLEPSENFSPAPEETDPLRIVVIDVGQGDATLVIGPSGRTMLIDGGPRQAGFEKVLPTLEQYGIDRLHYMIATHYDADHIGGLVEVLKGEDQISETEDDRIPSLGIWDRGDNTDKSTETYQDYVTLAAPYRNETSPGQRIELGYGAFAEVIVVNGRYKDGRVVHLNPDEENEASIGLLIQYGSFRYFTAGDLSGGGAPGGIETKDLETTAGEIIGDIDILHVNHHGSSSSSNAAFLEMLQPEASLISVGQDNDHGHPTDETLHNLEVVESVIYRTDFEGEIEVISNGNNYEMSIR